MSKVIFVADFFKEDITGGAELHDDVVLQYFKKAGILFNKIRCAEITEDYVNANTDKVWFIGNFVSLPTWHKQLFINKCRYILYEHDYKFLSNRNPIMFKDFVAPKTYLCNLDFYRSAQKVVCLSQFQRDIYERNLDFDNIVNLHCSMWSDDDLGFIETLIDVEKKSNVFAIIESNNPIKKTRASIEYCEKNNVSYELISSQDYHDFLSQLSLYEGLVFMTGHPEPTPRVAIEAKMLNCKFVSQKNLIGVAHEDYFHLTGKAMIQKVRELRNSACVFLLDVIETA